MRYKWEHNRNPNDSRGKRESEKRREQRVTKIQEKGETGKTKQDILEVNVYQSKKKQQRMKTYNQGVFCTSLSPSLDLDAVVNENPPSVSTEITQQCAFFGELNCTSMTNNVIVVVNFKK